MDPSFELDSQALGVPAVSRPKTTNAKTGKRAPHAREKKSPEPASAHGTIHVVKSGDNLFKILMRDYGLSNDEAETFIEEIRRENNIYDIRRLKIGQKITIPAVRRRADGTIKGIPSGAAAPGAVSQSFRLESSLSPLSEQEANVKFKQAWDRMLPSLKGEQKPIMLQSPAFSLTLDPQRYPIYATMDNGRILVDHNASIPALVKALITEKDPSVRIVSESPVNGKRFLVAMLESAGFYSVEENFSMDFGTDPKLTVRSDFKIEKTSESLMKQDVILMNAGRNAFSPVIGEFLNKEGFTVYEPFASSKHRTAGAMGQLYQITAKKQSDV
ncbi:MAG: LysM peptidoglycan-binding domain-containing protein, partial [Verrucomicrobia bacterium]|nr:LysM peptidoglycan-binding domain-containing protein [Deltaproteobacteria bacterium]